MWRNQSQKVAGGGDRKEKPRLFLRSKLHARTHTGRISSDHWSLLCQMARTHNATLVSLPVAD